MKRTHFLSKHPPPPPGNRVPYNTSIRNTTQRETLKNNYPTTDAFFVLKNQITQYFYCSFVLLCRLVLNEIDIKEHNNVKS
jgi:hypothetical protein